jgi:hypothetical protein
MNQTLRTMDDLQRSPPGTQKTVVIEETAWPGADVPAHPLCSLRWTQADICDVCTVEADHWHLLVLTTNGDIHGVNVDARTSVLLCSLALPVIEIQGANPAFGLPTYRLHASAEGHFAAMVVDQGRYGTVVDLRTGAVTMNLDGGDYHEDTVPFSACFLPFQERQVLVHRTAWNRLDVTDPATGASLSERHIAPYEGDQRPAHYLGYFHGQLLPNPSGSHVFDDGWVWHPISIPRVWSVTDWLTVNPWESEDGASLVDLMMRDDWTRPACWINEHQMALWGLASWDDNECQEVGQGEGVRIFDVRKREPSASAVWPMNVDREEVRHLFSDGERLYVATKNRTAVWDIATQTLIVWLPDFSAQRMDRARNTLVGFGLQSIIECSLRWPASEMN